MAESKNKDDQSSGYAPELNPVGDQGVVGDLGELEDNAPHTNGSEGGGRGRGDGLGKAWQQDGDWACPNTRSVM